MYNFVRDSKCLLIIQKFKRAEKEEKSFGIKNKNI